MVGTDDMVMRPSLGDPPRAARGVEGRRDRVVFGGGRRRRGITSGALLRRRAAARKLAKSFGSRALQMARNRAAAAAAGIGIANPGVWAAIIGAAGVRIGADRSFKSMAQHGTEAALGNTDDDMKASVWAGQVMSSSPLIARGIGETSEDGNLGPEAQKIFHMLKDYRQPFERGRGIIERVTDKESSPWPKRS